MDWPQHKLNNAELVAGSRRARGSDENLVVYVLEQIITYCSIYNSTFALKITINYLYNSCFLFLKKEQITIYK